jgi:excisionase family DNA binding protein
MNGTHSGSDPDHSTSRSGTDTTIGPLTVAEAAVLLGVEPRTVIKYRQQGKIRGVKQGKAWQLWLAQTFIDATYTERSGSGSGMDPEQQSARSGTHSEPFEAAYRVTPAEIEQAVSRTSAQYMGDLRTMLAEVGKVYEGQLAAKDAALAAKDETIATKDQALAAQALTIAELRRRAEIAEAEVLRQRQEQEATQATKDAPHAQEAPAEAQGAISGVWERLRHWFDS